MHSAQDTLANASDRQLPTARLGHNGPFVTRLGYGLMGLSCFYGPPKPDHERLAILDAAFEQGCRFWDTADCYADSEDLLEKRPKIFLATKVGFRFDNGEMSIDSSPEYVIEAAEKSLSRIGVEYVDLLYAHRVDKVTPIEKTTEAMKELKKQGKIRHIGLSEVSSETLRRACKVEKVDAVQVEYSPFSLDIESEQIGLLKTARELGVAIVAYAPLGRGMLGGNIRSNSDLSDDDTRKYSPRFSEENFPQNLRLVDTLTSIAEKKNVTASQLTLSWLLAQGNDVFPIPGTTSLPRIHENYTSSAIHLTNEETAEIRKACQEATVHGARYPEDFSKDTFADTAVL
ncbi:Aldo/keto reductase [Aureobasidium pullulans]|uniref:Aldo/keto reductase n=1 Tax=Aureobasidium pullulans TaxID=5580 RepID=A0A4V4IZK5_AURPU|nr:Aldo/keto reductase [Aureobasidium pullulans]